jgi:hypothetical protein
VTKTLPPETVFANLHHDTRGRLFTVTVLDRAAELARRVYSSDPVTYPTSGTKPMGQGAWTDQVVERAEVFVANTVAEFAVYFPDYSVIESLGCASALNVPISTHHVIGMVNILDVEQYFTPDMVDHCLDAIARHHDLLVPAMRRTRV